MTNLFGVDAALLIVVLVSVVTGLLMVVIFRYTSDQKAIRSAKDRLKAHLLAVRLFQDQLPVVLRSYGRILGGTGTYLRLAFKPLLFVIVPLTLLIVQLDHYLGYVAFQPGDSFLITARMNGTSLEEALLQLPSGLSATAPAVHSVSTNDVIWRVVAEKAGSYDVGIGIVGQSFLKKVVVSSAVSRLSPIRLRDHFWERFFFSAEPSIAKDSPVESVSVNYRDRSLRFAWLEWSWIWLFFVLSLVAGYLFKTVLGIEV